MMQHTSQVVPFSESILMDEDETWKEGDGFGNIVDFETNEMGVMYNDEAIIIAYKNSPDKLVSAISVCEPFELICTKYEFNHR